MLKRTFAILISIIGLTAGFSAYAASGTCPTDNGAGVGCNIGIGEYYCLSACRTGQTQCPNWTGTVCATGLTCPANCASADSCGYCNSCTTGYTLCGSYPSQTCTANTTAPAHCSSYNQCTATCTACAQGYELLAGQCIGATLKLGSDSVGTGGAIYQSSNPALYVLSSGSVGIGTSTPNATLEIIPTTGYSILAGSFKIGNVALPTADADAATKGYVDSVVASATSSISNLWGGTTGGNIWSLNSGNVGIGTTNPLYNLDVNGNVRNYSATTATHKVNSSGDISNGRTFIQLTRGLSPTENGWDLSSNLSQANDEFSIRSLVNSSATSRFTILSSGNVGIGTTNPLMRLQVAGNVSITGGSALYSYGTGDSGSADARWGNFYNVGAATRFLTSGKGIYAANIPDMYFSKFNGSAVTDMMMIQSSSGNVGIGTTTPLARLEVVPASGYSILAGSYKIGNVALPTADADAATKGYVDSTVASATSSITLWGGTTGGNIWNLNSGNVGIGTVSPSEKLEVSASSAGGIVKTIIRNTDVSSTSNGAGIGFSPTTAGWGGAIYTDRGAKGSLGGLYFGAVDGSGGSPFDADKLRMMISSSGNVGIGIASPISKLHVYGTSANPSGTLTSNLGVETIGGSVGNQLSIGSQSSAPYGMWLQVKSSSNNGNSYPILLNPEGGNVGIGTTSPIGKLDVLFDTSSGNRHLFTTSDGTRLQRSGDVNGWAMSYGFFNNDGTNQGGFGALGSNTSATFSYYFIGATYTSPLMALTKSGNVGISTTTPSARLEVIPSSGYSILAGNFKIGNVALPTADADAATKGYVDSTIASATSSITLWGGTTGGNIWSLNSGNVGIGTTSPINKFQVDYSNADNSYNGISVYNTITKARLILGSWKDVTASAYPAIWTTSNTPTISNYAFLGQGTMNLFNGESQIGFRIGNVDKVRIDSSGNVGIGTTTPSAQLHVNTTSSTGLRIDIPGTNPNAIFIGNATARLRWSNGSYFSNTGMYSGGSNQEYLTYDGADVQTRLFINAASGNIGIGTTTPLARLEVVPASGYSILAGSYKIGNVALPTADADAATKGYVDSTVASATSSITLWGGTTGGDIWNLNSGNVGIGTANPGYRFHLKDVTSSNSLVTLGRLEGNNGVIDIQDDDRTGYKRMTLRIDNKVDVINYPVFLTGTLGNSYAYFGFNGKGTMLWGSGSSNYDTNLYRNAANQLRTEDSLIVDGNVGIGTTTPSQKLEVVGNAQFAGTYPYINLRPTSWTSPFYFQAGVDTNTQATNNNFTAFINPSGKGFVWNQGSGVGSATMVINMSGNVGIGTTTPSARLEVVPSTGYSILAGSFKIGNVALPTADSDAATKGYVDSFVASATSTMSSIASFVGVTSSTYSGNNGGNNGYAYAHAQCAAAYAGSHVCAAFEIMNTIQSGGSVPSQDAWIFNGPPAYTAMANDCDARTSGTSAAYGAYWQKPATGYPEGRGLLIQCNNVLRFACCK